MPDSDPTQDLGEPTSYLAVNRGVPVFSSDGTRLGSLVRVMKDTKSDMFDGVVFDTTTGPGGHKFVDAPEVGEMFENGILLKITASEAASLEKPKSGKVRRGGLWGRLTGR